MFLDVQIKFLYILTKMLKTNDSQFFSSQKRAEKRIEIVKFGTGQKIKKFFLDIEVFFEKRTFSRLSAWTIASIETDERKCISTHKFAQCEIFWHKICIQK